MNRGSCPCHAPKGVRDTRSADDTVRREGWLERHVHVEPASGSGTVISRDHVLAQMMHGETGGARVASRARVVCGGLETEARSCGEVCIACAVSPDSRPATQSAAGPAKRVPRVSYHERWGLWIGHAQPVGRCD